MAALTIAKRFVRPRHPGREDQDEYPALNGRVEKAVKLALAGDVALHADGTRPCTQAVIRRGAMRLPRAPARVRTGTGRRNICASIGSVPVLVRRATELMQAEPEPVDPKVVPEPFPDNDPEEPEVPVCPGSSSARGGLLL